MRKKKKLYVPVIFLISSFAVAAGWISGIFSSVDFRLQDRLFQRPGVASAAIYVIGIDEQTLEALGPFETWSRTGVAMLVEKLTQDAESAPAVIGLDIGFYGERDPIGDARLVEACQRAGTVVVAGAATFGDVLVEGDSGSLVPARQAIMMEAPFDALAEVARWGHTNATQDADGIVRSALEDIPYGDQIVPSFAKQIYRAYTGAEPDIPAGVGAKWRFAYSGGPYAYYGPAGKGASFARVLSGEFPARAFRDSIVLIGAYASGMADAYDTALAGNARMYGVEIQANIIQAMMEGKYIREPALLWVLPALVCLWLAAGVLLYRLRMRASYPATLAMICAYIGIALALSRRYIYLPVFAPVLGLILPAVLVFCAAYLSVWRERRQLITNFSRYLPEEVARNVAAHGEEALRLEGARHEIAVLFVDIRGFTPLSERLAPEALVSLLNQYLLLTTSCIFDHHGTVDKFIGDATMALFNVPRRVDDYVYQAVCAACDMVRRSEALAQALAAEGFEGIGFGVGVHCGEAVIGNIGTPRRMEYTAIGDVVNTAARLENQAGPGEVLISDAVRERLGDRLRCTPLGVRSLKGKREGFSVWRVECGED